MVIVTIFKNSFQILQFDLLDSINKAETISWPKSVVLYECVCFTGGCKLKEEDNGIAVIDSFIALLLRGHEAEFYCFVEVIEYFNWVHCQNNLYNAFV